MKRVLVALFSFVVFIFGTNILSAQSSSNEISAQKVEEIIAYPNPTKDVLIIRTTQSNIRIRTVIFYDILGSQVASFSANSSSIELDINRLKPGKYLMKYFLSDNTQKVKQIIKQ